MTPQKLDHEEEWFHKLTGKFKHYCVEYDGLAIDETCEEFKYCLCFDEESNETKETGSI